MSHGPDNAKLDHNAITEKEVRTMSASTIATPAIGLRAGQVEETDRYAGIRQYSLTQILAIWAAAALPMGLVSWVVAPAMKDSFSGTGNVPLFKSLLLFLAIALIWQFALVAALVWREQRTLRWTVVRDVLWLRSPRSPRTGRVGGRLWLWVIPLTLLFAIGGLVPTFSTPANRDFATWIGSDAGQNFMHGNWAWLGVILTMFLFNTVLGEELLFRGLLLPRMKRVFGRGDWVANAALFGLYHVHMPWLMPGTLAVDTFAYVYPSRRFQSAWIGIAVHSSQTLLFGALIFALVLK
jgi:membrane protease YdiL (CAAX protease family)